MAKRIEKFISREEVVELGKSVHMTPDPRERSYQISKYARQRLREDGHDIDFVTMGVSACDGGVLVSAEARNG